MYLWLDDGYLYSIYRNQMIEEILIIDEEDEDSESGEPKLKQQPKSNQIYVFDDEEEDSVGRSRHQEKINTISMTHQQFKDKCSVLKDRIILSSVKNIHRNVMKSQTTFFQDARKMGRENQEKRKSEKIRHQSLTFSELPKDIKVDFIEGGSQTISKSQLRSEEEMEITLNDELIPAASKATVESLDIQGACLAEKKELVIEEVKDKNILKVSNFREFLYSQLKSAYQIYLLIKRTDNGFINSTYKIYFQENKKFIMSCEKQGFSKYVFSSSEVHISEDHISYLGKMESNFLGSEFMFYDSGEDNNKTKMMENYKKQLGYLVYTQEKDMPRKFQTYVTTCDNKLTDFTVINHSSENIVFDRWQSKNRENISYLCSKAPNFDPQNNNFKLDFRGIAGVPSTKNFIIESREYPDALIFGRQDKDTYLARIKAPFSLMQAMAACMSSIHYKFL